jgi:hypothetical protein
MAARKLLQLIWNALGRPSAAAPVPAGVFASGGGFYQSILASQSNVALTGGGGGAVGDYLNVIFLIPGTTSPGAVTIQDGTNTAITIFAGGASSVSNLVPFPVYVGSYSRVGAWKVTTGSNVSVLVNGKFT